MKAISSLPIEKQNRLLKAFEITGQNAYLIYLFPTLVKFMNVKDGEIKTYVFKLLNQISASFGLE